MRRRSRPQPRTRRGRLRSGRLDWPCSYDTPVRLVAIGVAAGVFSAFFGVGGGIVAVPLLIVAAGFPERVATGTSLMAIAITATAGVIAFSLRGEVEPGYAALVGLPAAAGALAGTALQQRVRTSTLTYGFAALLSALGVWLLVS
ncbi:MAG TPA: sulfite exporter TauE/SafE family protein [Gaiellaceae bacterium]|nr:sulfite exporter TauE/SafE family protein [Gaiellaceae bacterium]